MKNVLIYSIILAVTTPCSTLKVQRTTNLAEGNLKTRVSVFQDSESKNVLYESSRSGNESSVEDCGLLKELDCKVK